MRGSSLQAVVHLGVNWTGFCTLNFAKVGAQRDSKKGLATYYRLFSFVTLAEQFEASAYRLQIWKSCLIS